MTASRAAAAGIVYFAIVFAVAFLLGIVRVLALEPAMGVRAAELTELPLLAGLSLLIARRLTRARAELRDLGPALICGGVALSLLLLAELGVVLFVRGEDPADYMAGRDPVSGSAYLVVLALFGLAPALMRPR